MKTIAIILMCAVLFAACNQAGTAQTNSDAGEHQTSNVIVPSDIKGDWYLNKWALYRRLTFSDSQVVVDNHVDTIFWFNYSVSNDTLLLADGLGNSYKNKIIILTKDTLVIKGIASGVDVLRYSRISDR